MIRWGLMLNTSSPARKPFHLQLLEYLNRDFRFDLVSGVVVGLIALPLAIAFAVASGAHAEQGIYTSIIAGLVMGALSGSNYQICGPTGAFIVILLGVVNRFGLDGLMIAGFMAGIILLLLGIFRCGSLIKHMPYPVTVGFTAGIGVIIFSGQMKDFLGLTFAHRPGDFFETLDAIAKGIGNGLHPSSLFIGCATLVVYILWKHWNTSFPPAPFALLISQFFQDWLSVPLTISDIPSGLPTFATLPFSWEKILMLLPSAFTIAMLGAIESLLSAVVADNMTGTKHDSNRELISQGIGNIILPFFHGIPATGAIARTAANIKNGGRTRGSAIIHSVTLIAILLVAAPLARYIPLAALAAILMMVSVGMVEIPHFIRLFRRYDIDTLVLLTTFVLTVFVDLTTGVGVGILIHFALRHFFPHRETVTLRSTPEVTELE